MMNAEQQPATAATERRDMYVNEARKLTSDEVDSLEPGDEVVLDGVRVYCSAACAAGLEVRR